MIQIPITNIPNQSLSLRLSNSQYDIRIHSCKDNPELGTGIMAFDIVRNNIPIVTGMRAVPGFPLIPAQYLEDGNFIVLTMNDEYPAWRQFGITQQLVYASETELETIRGAGT